MAFINGTSSTVPRQEDGEFPKLGVTLLVNVPCKNDATTVSRNRACPIWPSF